MAKIFFISSFLFLPVLVLASVASDFTVNPQSTYDVPPGTTDTLILDLTLPNSKLKSIKIINAGNLQQRELLQLTVYEDGSSPGWDGDEAEKVRQSSSPFFDNELSADFSKSRIFITANVTSTAISGRTIKPELGLNSIIFADKNFNGPTDKKITGFERVIRAGVSAPSVPLSPLAQKGESISTSTVRWHFMDLSNNEFGFKILDANSKVTAKGPENISYLDETGLEPNTDYSNRRVIAYNDRGQSLVSAITNFEAVRTLPLPAVEEVQVQEETPAFAEATAGNGGPISPEEDLQAQIQEIQLKIIELLNQLIKLLQEQLAKTQASLFKAFESITDWLQGRF